MKNFPGDKEINVIWYEVPHGLCLNVPTPSLLSSLPLAVPLTFLFFPFVTPRGDLLRSDLHSLSDFSESEAVASL